MQIFDIHSHVLPKIDDGSQSWDETMKMVYQAYETGTTDLAITHHIINNSDYAREDEILEKFEELNARLSKAKIPLKLHLGSEIYYQHDIELDHRISTYNNHGKYFLVEFPMQGIPKFVDEKFFEFIVDGKTPVLAHPERNLGILQNPSRAYEFVQRGVLLQINAGSFLGRYGEPTRQLAISLMNARLAHFIGSDGHNAGRRPVVVREAYDFILEQWGERMATLLFERNPKKMLRGEEIKIPEPFPVETPRKKVGFGLFKRLGF
ncbi:MAG: histidinol-phosphatase [Calditrichaeota bacterium]|nr:MAG: histidinol-phosphatase [Calditrichota bacterium]